MMAWGYTSWSYEYRKIGWFKDVMEETGCHILIDALTEYHVNDYTLSSDKYRKTEWEEIDIANAETKEVNKLVESAIGHVVYLREKVEEGERLLTDLLLATFEENEDV